VDLLTIALLERIGILLVAAFIVSRIPSFKFLLDRELNVKTSLYYSVIFGLFGIAGTLAGVTIRDGELVRPLWFPLVESSDGLAHSGIVGIVMAGLLGGPVVGLGAGSITGVYLYFIGGATAVSYAISAPFIGILAGLIARFFSQERVISPVKSIFIGLFATILSMCFILIFSTPADQAIRLVNIVGIPMVITNSIAIAIFTTMIRVVLNEKEQAQALETKRALTIAERVLPYLKQGLNFHTAKATAQFIMNELQLAAVAVTDTKQILAHIGSGADHHIHGTSLKTESSKAALASGHVQIVKDKDQIQCSHNKCPLGAAILVPFIQSGHVAGLIKLYFRRPQQIRMVDIVLAQGLGKLISNQLSLAEAERMSILIKDAELRTLQAQINPHFLFNTLNSILSLIRVDPSAARHVTLQLAQFMRTNLKILSSSLIPLTQEMIHLKAYLEIVHTRFSEQITLHFQQDEHLQEALIPPSTIQPLVENSIQHGLKKMSTGGLINICIKQLDKHIQVTIEDNGSGIKPELLSQLGKEPLQKSKGNGVGLYNVNQRLIALLGEPSSLHIENSHSGGCRISFYIPNQSDRQEVSQREN
jgi:two-component system sensor histidine kinase LytS